MAGRPKRETKEPEKFQVWESGDKHEPFKIRNQKKEMKVEVMKKKEYQAEYREKKKGEKMKGDKAQEAKKSKEEKELKTAERK